MLSPEDIKLILSTHGRSDWSHNDAIGFHRSARIPANALKDWLRFLTKTVRKYHDVSFQEGSWELMTDGTWSLNIAVSGIEFTGVDKVIGHVEAHIVFLRMTY